MQRTLGSGGQDANTHADGYALYKPCLYENCEFKTKKARRIRTLGDPPHGRDMHQWLWLEEICLQESGNISKVLIWNQRKAEYTIIPNVQAVKAILTAAVSISKNTFSHIAEGLFQR